MTETQEQKNKFDEFNTPNWLCDEIVEILNEDKNALIFEPCVGKGNFINALQKNGYKNIKVNDI